MAFIITVNQNFFFLQLYFPTGISPIENSSCSSREKPAVRESHYPTYGACWVFQCFHHPPSSDMDCKILLYAVTHGGALTYVRECALKVDSWKKKKKPCRTEESNRSNALPTEPHHHHMRSALDAIRCLTAVFLHRFVIVSCSS